jgi:phosphatidylserine synthase
MPGRSRRFKGVAVVFAAVAVVGYVAFGWRFGDGTSNPIAFAIALVAVGFAVVSTIRGRT